MAASNNDLNSLIVFPSSTKVWLLTVLTPPLPYLLDYHHNTQAKFLLYTLVSEVHACQH
jgi:hypothetical protein